MSTKTQTSQPTDDQQVSFRNKYPKEHVDHATGIVSWTESEPFRNRHPFQLFRAYIPESGEEIILLTTTGGWSYHASGDEKVTHVIRAGLDAMKAQRKYNNEYREWHIVPMIFFLASWKPLFSRKVAIDAGNCTAGTSKWFSDNGYQDKEFVEWWQMFRHLFSSRSRMVVWHLWNKHKSTC